MKIDVTQWFLRLGTFAVISIMVGIVCLRLAPESDFSHFNATLNATVVDTGLMNDVRLGISGTLACLTAVIQVFKTVFKLKPKWYEQCNLILILMIFMFVDRPGVHAVWVYSHLSVWVLHQRFHDCCRPADPHFCAQVHLWHPCATLWWPAGSYLCKWLLLF